VAGYGALLMVLMHKILCHDAVKTSVLVREKRLNFFGTGKFDMSYTPYGHCASIKPIFGK
jgi:hypothetical protein